MLFYRTLDGKLITNRFCRNRLYRPCKSAGVCAERIIRPVVSCLPLASLYGRAVTHAKLCIDIGCTACLRRLFYIGIYIFYSADALRCTAACLIEVACDIVIFVQAVVKADDAADICLAVDLSAKGISCKGIDYIIPNLCDMEVATEDAADILIAAYCCTFANCVAKNIDSLPIRCGCSQRIIRHISAADNAADVFFPDDAAIKAAVLDCADLQCVISGTDDAADNIFTVYRSVVLAVFNRSLHTTCKTADHVLISVTADYRTRLDGTVFNACNKGCADSCIWVFSHVCAKQTGLHNLRAGFDGYILNCDRGTGKSNALKIVDKSVAIDSFPCKVQILYRRAFYITQQRQTTVRNRQCIITCVVRLCAVNRSRKSIEIFTCLNAGYIRIDLAAYRRPIIVRQ